MAKVTLTNLQIRDALGAINSLQLTGDKDELGRPVKRRLTGELRPLGYALHKNQKALTRAWEDVSDRFEEERKAHLKTVKVDTGEKDDKGNPVIEETERFKTVKSKKEYTEWLSAELDEKTEVEVHLVVDDKCKKILEAGTDEALEDLYPDLYELEFLWDHD